MRAPARARRRRPSCSPWRCCVRARASRRFPEYGPERRGSPMRAYTRYDEQPIRRHDAVEEPDLVVVLEPSLASRPDVRAGLRGLLLVSSERPEPGALCVPAARIAPDGVNLVMLGAVAAVLGEPGLDALVDAAVVALGRKADPTALRAALEGGYAAAKEQQWAA
jgi:Pyruvate/2-oxoacid:ferredoxin oxidoreductase gamma subunit